MIETMLTFFALGTLGFYLLLAVSSIIFIAAIENEKYALPNCLVIGLSIVYWKQFVALALDWRAITIGIVIYLLIGIAWSMFRWFKYVKKQVAYYKDRYNDLKTGMNYLKSDIDVSSNKGKIIALIIYWPWSFIWNIAGDFLTMIYDSLKGIYQRISDNALKQLNIKDL